MPQRRRVVLAGVGDLYEEICAALEEAGADVHGLEEPDDDAIREALEGCHDFDVVCVVAREDPLPLRIALLVRHLDEAVPLVATVFDRETAAQLRATVPNLEVTSLADVVAPSLAGPCVDAGFTAIHRDDTAASSRSAATATGRCSASRSSRPARRSPERWRRASSPPTTAAPA